MGSLTITRFSPEDMPGMIALRKLYYGDNDLCFPDHFRWKYLQGPDGPAHIMVCKDMSKDGLIVGQYFVIPRQAKIGERTVLVGLMTDVLVHSDYRGQGIFGKLGEALYADCTAAGLAFSYGVPNPVAYPVHTKKLKSPDIGRVPLLLKPIDLRGLSKRPSGIPLVNVLLSLLQIIYASSGWVDKGREQTKTLSIRIRELEQFGVAFDDFWNQVEKKRSVMIKRTAKYLEWRFGSVPRRVYRKFVAEENDQMRGYIVARIIDVQRIKCGMVADFVVEDSTTGWEAGNLLISTLTEYFKAEKVALSGCLMLPDNNEFRLLQRRGYFVCPPRLEPQPFPVVQRPHQTSVLQSPASDIGNWFFTMGDYDTI